MSVPHSRDRHRFPGYAQESLEKRLNPSGVVDVAFPNCGPPEYAYSVPETLPYPKGTDPAPPPGDGDPPIEDPNIPIGPDLPA